MKKIYLALAATIAAGLSASATVDYKSMSAVQMENANLESIVEVKAVSSDFENGPMRAPASKGDADGIKIYEYYSLRSDSPGAKTGSVQITFKDDKNVEILGLFADVPIAGTFDADKGTIRIAKQKLWYHENYKEDVYLFTQHINPVYDDEGNVVDEEHVDIDYIEFGYYPDGAESVEGGMIFQKCWIADPYDLFTISMQSIVAQGSGFDWMYSNVFEPIDYRYGEGTEFTYNESEWENYGTAQIIKDGWLLGEVDPYEVPLLVNKANATQFLVVKPFGPDTPYGEGNVSTVENGFIYLNAENPDCVLVRPFIAGGFNNPDVVPGELYFTSKEGSMYYLEGYTVEEIIEEAEFYGDEVAKYDRTTGIVDLPRCLFSLIYSLPNPEGWVNSETKEPIPMVSQIKLIAGAGVEGIINDTENVAKRFFNLQGVEIANPEAGQVVIVKQGNKTSKTIIR